MKIHVMKTDPDLLEDILKKKRESNRCACKSTDARECAVIRYGIEEDYQCECICHQQRIKADIPPGPPDLSDIEKKIKHFFYA